MIQCVIKKQPVCGIAGAHVNLAFGRRTLTENTANTAPAFPPAIGVFYKNNQNEIIKPRAYNNKSPHGADHAEIINKHLLLHYSLT